MSGNVDRPGNLLILAAGMGMRLRPLTDSVPKALVSCAGWPLLSYAIRFAREAVTEGGRIVVVAGYRGEMVAGLVEAEAPGAVVVWNHNYQKGNLLSVMAGLSEVAGGGGGAGHETPGGFLLMNVDHIYPWAFAARMTGSFGRVVAAVDRDRRLGPDDMKVRLDGDGRVRAISKGLDRFDAGYIGMTLVRSEAAAAYRDAVQEARRRRGDSAIAEDALQVLADWGEDVSTCDLSGLGWLEVDTLDELAAAESCLMDDEGFLARSW